MIGVRIDCSSNVLMCELWNKKLYLRVNSKVREATMRHGMCRIRTTRPVAGTSASY